MALLIEHKIHLKNARLCFLTHILTRLSLDPLAFTGFLFRHNETDSFNNGGCTVLLQSMSVEGDLGSAV